MNEQTEVPTATAEDLPRSRMNEAREAASLIPIRSGGITPLDMAQAFDFAKAMATASLTIPAHFKGNIGDCLAIVDRARTWGMSPYGVAELTVVVNGKLGYMAQLWVAVINMHAGLKQRLRPEYEGEGDELVCTVRGHFNGEVDPCEYVSPPLGKIFPKNSPLWKTDPEQQIWYYSARAFCRRYCPHVMLGIRGDDELRDIAGSGAENAIDVSPGAAGGLHDRLKAHKAENGEPEEGFRDGAAASELDASQGEQAQAGDGEGKKARSRGKAKETRTTERPSEPQGHSGGKPADTPGEEGAAHKEKDTPAPARAKKEPKNLKQYREWLEGWLAEHDDADEIETRWAGSAERKLRNACGVTSEDREELKKLVDARVAKLGK